MRKIGIILVVSGIVCFLAASVGASHYDTVQGALRAAFSEEQRTWKQLWNILRWVGIADVAAGAGMILAGSRRGA